MNSKMKTYNFKKAVLAIIIVFVCLVCVYGQAEDEYENAWAICKPGNHINIRSRPSKKGEEEGWLEPGDMIYLDGKRKNGYVHCVELTTEAGEGWVHEGYLVYNPVEFVDSDYVVSSKSRLAARKNVNGKRAKWIKKDSIVHVYYWSEEWSYTEYGYIKSQYLERQGE